MPATTAYELREYSTKRPLSRHSSVEGAMLSALFHVRIGQRVTWTDAHGTVDGVVKFEIVELEYKENPNQIMR